MSKRVFATLIAFATIAMMLASILPVAAAPGPATGNAWEKITSTSDFELGEGTGEVLEPENPNDDGGDLEGPGTGTELMDGPRRTVENVDGDLLIDSDTHLEDGVWVVNGSVKVKGAKLTLDNVDLTFQNLSPRAHVSFEVESDGWLLCRNSTLFGKSMTVSMQLEGRADFFDSRITSEVPGTAECWINSWRGRLKLEDSVLDRVRLNPSSNVTVRRCEFWNYSSGLAVFFGWPVQGATYTVIVEDSTFHQALNTSKGVSVAGAGQMNVDIDVTVRNCTFEGLQKAVELSMFYKQGRVLVERNTITNCTTGLSLLTVGPVVTCANNTIEATDGIVLVNQVPMAPRIRDETVRADQYGLRLSVPMKNWTLTGLDIEADIPIRCDKSHLTVTNSSLGTSGTLEAMDGTMTLSNCSHGHAGQVWGEGSWIRESLTMTFNVSSWTCGPAMVAGVAEVIDANGTVLASKPNDMAMTVPVLRWQVTAMGAEFYQSAHGSFVLEGWEFTTSAFALAEGAFQELEFNDDFAPEVTIESPSEGDLITGNSVELLGGFEEVGTGVVSMRARYDDGPWVEVLPITGCSWSVTLVIEDDGIHLLTVAVEDMAGNVGAVSVEVTIDACGPPVEVLEPAPWVNDPDVELVAKTEIGCRAFVNDAEVTVLADGTFRRSLHLSGGVEAVHIRVVDLAGNTRELNYSIELDLTPPIIAIDTPTDGEWLGATEVHASGLAEDGASVLVNGLEPERDGLSWSIVLTSEEGNLDIIVTAEDRAGNVATRTILVHVDLTPPSLKVTAPDNGTVHTVESVNVTGWTIDLSPVTVLVNGRTAVLDGHDWYLILELDEGDNALAILARDEAGNERLVEMTLHRDTVAPSVTVTLEVGDEEHEPGASLAINRTDVTLVVEVDEPCVLTVAGFGTFDLSAGENRLVLCLAADQSTELDVSVVDLAGNAAPGASFTVVTDLVPPSLEVLEPSPGEVLRQSLVQLKGNAEPDTTVTVGGEACPIGDDGTFVAELWLEEGTQTVVVIAVDPAGNKAVLEVELTYEPEGQGSGEVDDSTVPIAPLGAVVALVAASVAVWWWKWRRQ